MENIWVRDPGHGKNSDPGSGKNIPDPQHGVLVSFFKACIGQIFSQAYMLVKIFLRVSIFRASYFSVFLIRRRRLSIASQY
jgi:hypothetical protein